MEHDIFRRLTTSTVPYKIALVIAIFLLLFIASINYKQIRNLETSADLVSHSLMVDKEINNLFSQYSLMESAEFRSVILMDSTFTDSYINYKLNSDRTLKGLFDLTQTEPEHQASLDSVTHLKDSLHSTLTALHGKVGSSEADSMVIINVQKAATILKSLRGIKTNMLLKKEEILQENLAAYNKLTTLTPLTSLLLALFSLGVFAAAYSKLRRHKDQIQSSGALLQNIVQGTDNIMNYYEPIYNLDNEVIDFEIVFANECNRDYLGLDPKKIVGEPISKVFPFLLLNGELKEMVAGFKKGETMDFKRQVALNGENFWFHSIIKPMKNGILEVTRNNTEENKAHDRVLDLYERLKVQNEELQNTEAFLESILRSTNNVIMSFEPIQDDSDFITDFRFLFVNEQIGGITGDSPNKVIGEKVSEVHPSTFESGVFEKMVECYEGNKPVEYETSYEYNGKLSWFHGTAMRSGNTVTITANDITMEKHALDGLEKLYKKLEIQNSIMVEAKKMAKIGSFTWHFETDTAEISDNFYSILDFEPGEIEISLEKFRSLVHRDDLKQYEKIERQAMEKQKPSERTFRVVTKKDRTIHLRTKARFVQRDGETLMIGVVQDVTDQIKASNNLRMRNLQLKRSNAELESFNRVASHDLQEPLRKIQLFISRFEEVEKNKLSEKGEGYFNKINDAAARMRSLIHNLLTYSRIDSSHEDFEKVDLNEVLQKVQEDFSEDIKATKATIVSEKLPTVRGIFFQMEQLLSNLIANALKYHDSRKALKIVLQSEKVHRKQIPEDFIKQTKHYHKLTLVDNGIGFANENADKIFEVFQRLHQKTEYSGTGIGLAICKKVVENHHGFIYAASELGKGSAFILYLPA